MIFKRFDDAKLNEIINENICFQVVDNLKKANLNTPNHLNKYQALQFVANEFSVDELKRMGFDCSKRSIGTAKRWIAANRGDIVLKKPLRKSEKKLSDADIDLINLHYFRCSRPVPNAISKRETKKRGRIVQKRIMCMSYRDCYDTFPARNRISERVFYHYRSGEFSKAKRDSDKCSYCVGYHNIIVQLHRKLRAIEQEEKKSEEEGYSSDDDVLGDPINIDIRREQSGLSQLNCAQIARLKKYFDEEANALSDDERRLWKNKLENYEIIVEHREDKARLRAKYNHDIDHILPHEMVMVMDYKQNLVVGHCADEEHWVFKHLSQRTCLNITVFFKFHVFRFDVISDCLRHSSLFSKTALKKIMDEPPMQHAIKEYNINTIKIWSDNAKHFKSNKFLYCPLVELMHHKTYLFHQISMNYFAPYHGKSDCDAHFGNISYWVDYYSTKWTDGVLGSDDICRAIKTGSDRAKKYFRPNQISQRSVRNRDRISSCFPINLDFIKMDRITRNTICQKYGIEHYLQIPFVSSLHYIESNIGYDNLLSYCAWRDDDEYHERIQVQTPQNTQKSQVIIKSHDDLLFANFPDVDDKEWTRYVKRNNSTRHTYNLIVKPYPYSDDDTVKQIQVHLGIDITPSKKAAPYRVPPQLDCSQIRKNKRRRNELCA